jgi:hypothetical protein
MLKRIVVLAMGLVFLLSPLAVFAADQWAVIKDSKGICSVRKVKAKTAKTIAGPFASKAEAEKAKKEQCPPGKPGKR